MLGVDQPEDQGFGEVASVGREHDLPRGDPLRHEMLAKSPGHPVSPQADDVEGFFAATLGGEQFE